MAGEILRSALTGLALWWHEHPHVPRERITNRVARAVGGVRGARLGGDEAVAYGLVDRVLEQRERSPNGRGFG
jgi:hypothetical protein